MQPGNRIGALCYELRVKCSEKSLVRLNAAARRFLQANYDSILAMLPPEGSPCTGDNGGCAEAVSFCITVCRVGASGQVFMSVAITRDKPCEELSIDSSGRLAQGGSRACVYGEVRRWSSYGGCGASGEAHEPPVLVETLLAETAVSTLSQDHSSAPLVSDSYDTEARGRQFRVEYQSLRGEFFIFYSHGKSLCRRALSAMGFKEMSPEQEDVRHRPLERMAVMWCNSTNSAAKRKGGLGYYIVNRLRYRGLLANKCSLARCLKEFEKNHPRLVPAGLESSSFYPETIHLNGSTALSIFSKIRCQHGLFLLKPGHTDCGEGIAMHRSDGSLTRLTADLAAKFPGFAHKDLVLQRYIDRPLLLGGRKFDLRVYLLLVPNQRYGLGMRGLYAFCHPGYVRRTCRPYQADSEDPLLHLTNQAVQQRDPAYAEVKEDTVWSPDQLNAHLNAHLQELGVPCVDWARRRLYPRIRAVLGHVISIASSSLCDQLMSFELMGCDFLVDASFNVWLLEINSDPSLNKSTRTLGRIVTQAVEEAVGLAVEVLQRAARGRSVKRLTMRQDFRKIFSHTNESTLRRVMSEAGLSYLEYLPPLPATHC